MSVQYSIVQLRVKAKTEFGQVIHVSGSSYTMGNFSTSEAVPLVTTRAEYPYWRTSKPLVIPRGVPQAYKYAVFENGEFKRWETLSIPRIICIDEFYVELEDELDVETDPRLPSPPGPRGEMIANIRRNLSENANDSLDMPQESRRLLETSKKEYHPPPGSKIFLVCFHLPVMISKDDGGNWKATWNESLIAKTENSISSEMETYWVGTVSKGSLSEADQAAIKKILEPMRCHPIFLAEELIEKHYHGYCKQIMWPLFHNVEMLDSCSAHWKYEEPSDPEATWNPGGKEGWWQTYVKVNEIFRDVVIENCKMSEGDVLWVHDYHLMLLPTLISRHEHKTYGRRVSSIIFFLHIPFPTSQIFRALHCAEDLLTGMLNADVVGFHAFDHARHFLNACKRVIGLAYHNKSGGLIGIDYEGRTVTVLISHVGVEGEQLNRAMNNPETQATAQALRDKHPGKVLIAGLEPSQRLSGIALKLLAFERLLSEYECYRDRVVMVQRSLLTGSRVQDEKATSAEVRKLVARVNKQFGPVIDYEEIQATTLPLQQRVALWLASDIILISAVREGLNLYPLEFTFCKTGEDHNSGVVLSSEFSASSTMLNGAFRINPFDIKRVATTMDHALKLDTTDRLRRRERDLPYISERPSSLWTRQVLQDLWANKAESPDLVVEPGGSRIMHQPVWKENFKRINVEEVVAAFSKAKRRFIFTDFGGTLMEKEKVDLYIKRSLTQTTGKRPSKAVLDALRVLSEDPQNELFVISGLQLLPLEEVFGHLDKIGLAAANGLYLSMPNNLATTDSTPDDKPQQKGKKRAWSLLDYGVNWAEVKEIALPILERFTARTNGSSVRLRDPGLAWSYYMTDPEWGLMQARALIVQLEDALSAHDVKVVHLTGMVEIVPRRLNKGVVLRYAIQSREGPPPEFIMCIGDDASDEYMFTAIYSYVADMADQAISDAKAKHACASSGEGGSDCDKAEGGIDKLAVAVENVPAYIFTCSVGRKRTHASFFVQNSEEICNVLETLANVTA